MLHFFGFIWLFTAIQAFPFTAGTTDTLTCNQIKKLYDHVNCEDDGSFSPIQCRNGYCVCVNTTTGTPLPGATTFKKSSVSEEDAIESCRKIAQCNPVLCFLYCPLGYEEDDRGCTICQCKSANCTYTSPFALINNCHNRCIRSRNGCYWCDSNCDLTNDTNPVRCGDTEEYVLRGYGWGTCVPKLKANDKCERPVDDVDDVDDDDDDVDDDDDSSGDAGDTFTDIELELLSSDEEDEILMEESDEIAKTYVGSSARRSIRRLRKLINSCRSGYYCRRKGLSTGICRPINTNGRCYRIHGKNSKRCDNNGYFRPRFCCQLSLRSRKRCVCINPRNGTEIPNTNVILQTSDARQTHQCTDAVYGFCSVNTDGKTYIIKHGRYYVRKCSCRRCKCFYGRLICRRRSNCRNNCPTNQRNCTLPDGNTLQHGGSQTVDCNKCACRYGQLYCTDRDCDNSTCAQCFLQKVDKVCGPNGRTYINRCFAECAGVATTDLFGGPCPRINPCQLYPCQTGETCFRRGGVTCLALNDGCHPDTLRYCVNITSLECENNTAVIESDSNSSEGDNDDIGDIGDIGDIDDIGDGDIDPNDTSVCATDGNTYRSVCHLLQNTVNVQVLHAGRCNDTKCRGGPVCGTDGETYNNICILRTYSNNARVDYHGRCVDDDIDARNICRHVHERSLCSYNRTNCPQLVQPVIGCCPVCGGSVLALLDQAGIRNASRVDSSLGTLDGFTRRLLADHLFENTERCTFESTLTIGGNVELIIIARDRNSYENTRICHDVATNVAMAINGDTPVQLSSTYQFLLGAIEAPTVEAQTVNPSPTPTSSATSINSLLSFICVIIVFVAATTVY